MKDMQDQQAMAPDAVTSGLLQRCGPYVLLAAIAALHLLYKAAGSGRRRDIFLAGILLGIAVLMKQHGMFFLPVGAFLIAWGSWSPQQDRYRRLLRETLLFGAGAALPLLLLVLLLAYQGVLDRFWCWTFQ